MKGVYISLLIFYFVQFLLLFPSLHLFNFIMANSKKVVVIYLLPFFGNLLRNLKKGGNTICYLSILPSNSAVQPLIWLNLDLTKSYKLWWFFVLDAQLTSKRLSWQIKMLQFSSSTLQNPVNSDSLSDSSLLWNELTHSQVTHSWMEDRIPFIRPLFDWFEHPWFRVKSQSNVILSVRTSQICWIPIDLRLRLLLIASSC